MDKGTQLFIAVAAVVALGGILYIYYLPSSPAQEFAQCLTEKGVRMYGTFWCPHCKNQKNMFGDSWQYVDYVECSTPDGAGQLQVCRDAGITGYPTWVFPNGVRKAGELSLEDLSRLSGCPLE